MNIDEAKEIRLVDFLATLGHRAVKVQGLSYWYLSPFRNEKHPSFKVNDSINDWYDFGIATGGDIIDLGKILYRTNSISDVLRALEGNHISPSAMRIHPATALHQSIQEKMKDIEVIPLKHKALLSYLHTRSIDLDIGKQYCREIHYTYYRKKYFAIAFQNSSNGYEIRNSYFKGCVNKKDITFIPYINGEQQEDCCVFEGFMDFLSFLTLQQKEDDYRIQFDHRTDYIILNSVSNIKKCFSLLEKYANIHCLLDNDLAGENAVKILKQLYDFRIVNESFRYCDYKDLNDYLMGRQK